MNIYSMQVDRAEIKLALEKINAFTQAYIDFAVTPNPIIPSKIYEMILYAFTSPFIWQIRRKCSFTYDKVTVADIPLFCMLGGTSGSGKSTALRFAANLMGQRGQEIYDYSKELDKAGSLYDLIKSNNLMPIFADEVGTSFFKGNTSARKGENLIKSLSNEIPSEPMGAFIGTTNASEFSAPSQVMRRIYYIEVSSKFDTKKRRSKSITYLKKINEGLNDELFKDFTFRFSQAIRDNEEIFLLEDFLSLTRKIFLSYYAECNMEVPEYFPREIFKDYLKKQVEAWNDLFSANRNCFIVKGDEVQVNIDEIFRNSTKAVPQKEKLLNFLDENCIARDPHVGVNWFLRKDAFYKFIGYTPTAFEKVKNTLQKFLTN